MEHHAQFEDTEWSDDDDKEGSGGFGVHNNNEGIETAWWNDNNENTFDEFESNLEEI